MGRLIGTWRATRLAMLDSFPLRFARFVLRLPRIQEQTAFSGTHRVRWSNTTARDLLLMVGLAWLPTACGGDECQRGEVRCSDNAAQVCDYRTESDQLDWSTNDCGAAFCKLSNDPGSPRPFCAKSMEPDPRCASSAYFEFCDGNQVIGCHQGYVEHTVDCTTGETFGPGYQVGPSANACVAQADAAQCVLSSVPNPACPTDTVATPELAPLRDVCDGDNVLICFYEFAEQVENCPTGGTCVPDKYFCALATAPDPECPIIVPAGFDPSFCRNGVMEHCRDGWVIREDTCATGTRCVDGSSGQATCQVI